VKMYNTTPVQVWQAIRENKREAVWQRVVRMPQA